MTPEISYKHAWRQLATRVYIKCLVFDHFKTKTLKTHTQLVLVVISDSTYCQSTRTLSFVFPVVGIFFRKEYLISFLISDLNKIDIEITIKYICNCFLNKANYREKRYMKLIKVMISLKADISRIILPCIPCYTLYYVLPSILIFRRPSVRPFASSVFFFRCM